MRRIFETAVALLVVATAAPLAAQSLADVAQREEERRKAVRAPGKVYTNESLRPEPLTSTPSAAAPAQPGTPEPTPPAGTPAAGAGTQPPQTPGQPAAGQPGSAQPAAPAPSTEVEWRKRVASAREALTRSQTFAEALQSRINALSTDFVNRDDPVQRDQIAAERQKALSELDRVRREIQDHQKAIAAIQEEARKAGVPAGWVR
jgi:hypothetical protein